jgi:hypothetical protein
MERVTLSGMINRPTEAVGAGPFALSTSTSLNKIDDNNNNNNHNHSLLTDTVGNNLSTTEFQASVT